MNVVATRARFITKRKCSACFAKLSDQFVNGFGRVNDLTEETQLAVIAISNRYCDGLLVYIKSYIFAKVLHDLPP
jgi:hypothetical protein